MCCRRRRQLQRREVLQTWATPSAARHMSPSRTSGIPPSLLMPQQPLSKRSSLRPRTWGEVDMPILMGCLLMGRPRRKGGICLQWQRCQVIAVHSWLCVRRALHPSVRLASSCESHRHQLCTPRHGLSVHRPVIPSLELINTMHSVIQDVPSSRCSGEPCEGVACLCSPPG